MPSLAKLTASLAFAGLATAALGQAALSDENLLVSPPKDFKVGFQSNHDNTSMTEFVPAAETVADWTQMLTVQIVHGLKMDAATFLTRVGGLYENACPGTTAKGIFTGQVNGYVVSMLVLRCPLNPKTGKPETTAFRVIKGTDALYDVQRAWRSVPPEQDFDEAMRDLGKVSVCDTRTPDHPCPRLEPAGRP